MRAAVIHEHGGLDRVRVEQVQGPHAAEWEVVVAVRAAALNHLDIHVRNGGRAMSLKMPHILGSEAAGVVAEVGHAVHGVEEGDEVVVNPGLSCGCCEYCRRGEQSECARFGIVGLTRHGTFAERVAVPAVNVWPKPAHLDFEKSSALVLAHLTAWRMLVGRAHLRAGETVLIHGIGGGVALAALQIAKLAGAEAIVTSSSDEKLARAKSLGADHAINYRNVDSVAEVVGNITACRGVDVAVDTVGAATWPIDFSAVRRGGRIVLCGVTSGASAETDLRTLYWNQLTILGSTLGSNEELRQMLRAVEAAHMEPLIDSTVPLERMPEAMGRMEAGLQFGKIVLKIAD